MMMTVQQPISVAVAVAVLRSFPFPISFPEGKGKREGASGEAWRGEGGGRRHLFATAIASFV